MTDQEIIQSIEQDVKSNKIIMFVKGTKTMPQCGFSAATITMFNKIGKPFETRDILANPDLRRLVPAYSDWPTFPQVFIGGQFVGGCDICTELFEQGELQKMVEAAAA
ncbi:MAG: Grx4 family monothiol glutaredoxin [Candidatus Omnitrophica bacterium]|jgi:monothiol glutaredoxin|nr:Grx4 family monothiol glutaredoxin [Candidatus Omnitrophota bacterium]